MCHDKVGKKHLSGQHVDWLVSHMPSSQQRLSTQTNKGAAASAFTFSVVNSVGGFLAKRIADLGSAIPFRRGDDMVRLPFLLLSLLPLLLSREADFSRPNLETWVLIGP